MTWFGAFDDCTREMGDTWGSKIATRPMYVGKTSEEWLAEGSNDAEARTTSTEPDSQSQAEESPPIPENGAQFEPPSVDLSKNAAYAGRRVQAAAVTAAGLAVNHLAEPESN